MMNKTLLISLLSIALFVTGCKKDFKKGIPVGQPELQKRNVTIGSYTSTMPYNLNVVYFVPQGVGLRPEYERRVSEFMLSAQEYYRQNMYNWGFGNRSFGLLKNPSTNRIKINIVYGQYPMSSYNYGSGSQILSEVNAWFAANPGNKTSDHTLIFTATPSLQTEIPYYGQGMNCFVGDNEGWDLQYINQNTPQGNQAKASMGGFLHELGHCLGLPHDALGKSLINVPGYGTSLMGLGNYTYGYSSTILTKAACAILNNCQLFSATTKPAGYFYQGNNAFDVNITSKSLANGKIYINGTYTVGAPINALNSYFSPSQPYYQVSGTGTYTATSGSFSTYIDTADLYTSADPGGAYQFIIQAQFVNGQSSWKTFNFNIKDGVVNLNFELDRSAWTMSTSSQYSAYPASLAIDGNVNTYWHTNYAAGSVQTDPVPGQAQTFPFYFDINMGKINPIGGISLVQHQGLVRTAKSIKVYVRATTSDGWTLAWWGDISNITSKIFVPFGQQHNARFIRIVFDASYDGQPYIAMPEIGAYQ